METVHEPPAQDRGDDERPRESRALHETYLKVGDPQLKLHSRGHEGDQEPISEGDKVRCRQEPNARPDADLRHDDSGSSFG